jgi:D-galacturonate reductase
VVSQKRTSGTQKHVRSLTTTQISADVADKSALKALPKGSAVIIFTPDSTHFPIASEALNLGHHVLVTKPATQKVEDHQKLIDIAKEKGLICFVEHHKRFEYALHYWL